MFLVGFLYLILEDIALADFTWAVNSNPSLNKTNKNIQRTLTGIQVGLILLSMLVTRSSALSLQAKRGLPVGNQVLGWAILSTLFVERN
ncbi:GPI ethanolamine phosphate transferase 1 [Metarhizium anisopliae]